MLTKKGFFNTRFYVDDGISGTTFERDGFKTMLNDVQNGEVKTVIVKDMSRFGRDYIQVGMYTEILFPQNNVRFIAINDSYDSANGDNDFIPFKNIMNEWYLRDCSRKIKAVLQAKGRDGKPITNNPPYGYIKDPEDKNHWLIDEEAAAVVRRIFRMAVEGIGPYQIARILTEEKVEKPSYYQAKRGYGCYKNRCDMSKPYEWAGVSVVRMLEKPEYMGDTVNFRTKKLSYKDKTAVRNDSDEIVVFTDTHEAIIDRKTWYMVQELRKTKRRINTEGESNPFVGKIFCADCGGKMHYRNEGKRAGRKWRGLPDGSVRTTPACYNCGNYNNSHDQSGKVCCSHNIQAKVIDQLVLETIQYACKSVRMDERAFVESIRTNICKLSDRHKK